jgi:hypothetical protein
LDRHARASCSLVGSPISTASIEADPFAVPRVMIE